jgi:hypothetical protein
MLVAAEFSISVQAQPFCFLVLYMLSIIWSGCHHQVLSSLHLRPAFKFFDIRLDLGGCCQQFVDFLTGLLIPLIFSLIFTARDFLFSGWTPGVTLLSLDLAQAWWALFVPVCWPRNSFFDLCARSLGSQSALAPDFHFPTRSQLSRRANCQGAARISFHPHFFLRDRAV